MTLTDVRRLVFDTFYIPFSFYPDGAALEPDQHNNDEIDNILDKLSRQIRYLVGFHACA
jgi:hypothetical protein